MYLSYEAAEDRNLD